MNEPMENWERLLAQKIEALPDWPAPFSLAPRVLAALARQSAAPWWKRPWFEWPRRARGALIAAACIPALATLAAAWAGQSWGRAFGAKLSAWLAPLSAGADLVRVSFDTTELLLHSGGWILWSILLGWGILCYLACLGFGAACWRVLKHSAL